MVTPCILPERGTLKRVRVCGPCYWPQVIEVVHEDYSRYDPDSQESLQHCRACHEVGGIATTSDPCTE